MSNTSAIMVSQNSERHNEALLQATLSVLPRRDAQAIEKSGSLKECCDSLAHSEGKPVSAAERPTARLDDEKISFLKEVMSAVADEIENLKTSAIEDSHTPPPRDYEKEISDLQNKLEEASRQRDQLLDEKTKLDKLYVDAVAIQASKIAELEETQIKLTLMREKHNYASNLELLKIAELHKCYVHGRYVRDVIVPALRRDFGKCKNTSIHLVMRDPSLLPVLLQNAGERLREYKDKITLSGYSVKKYHWFDSLGDITAKVRIYLEKIEGGYESESLSSDVYFIPSKNQIVTSNSLSQFYDDCDKNLYRLTEEGWNIIYNNQEKAKERYLNKKLEHLMKKYTVTTHHGRKMYSEKETPASSAEKIRVAFGLFWVDK